MDKMELGVVSLQKKENLPYRRRSTSSSSSSAGSCPSVSTDMGSSSLVMSSAPSSSSSSFASSRSYLSHAVFPPTTPSRFFALGSIVKCDMSESSKHGTGKPILPIFDERTQPKHLEAEAIEKTVKRNSARLKLFSGTANPSLSQLTSSHLEIAWNMGLELGKIKIKRFADGEIYGQSQESVRGCDVFLVQPTCSPANENLMELLVMVDACRRASAKNITAVIPYFGYARADRKTQGRESIAAKLIANLITEAGANRVLACDLHSGQSMGYFDIPVDHVYCQPVILDYLASKQISSHDFVVVSPDVGGVATAVMNLIGDVKGKVAVMVDDMIDTAGTIAKGAALLHQEGAREVYACCTHAVFSPPAIERLSGGLFQEVIVRNTITVAENCFPTIWRVHGDCSVSIIFQ